MSAFIRVIRARPHFCRSINHGRNLNLDKRLVSGLKVWDAETGQELLTFNGGSFDHCVAFRPHGHHLASNAGGTVKIYDAMPVAEKPWP